MINHKIIFFTFERDLILQSEKDTITYLTLDSIGYILVTDSRDITCVNWYLLLNDNRHIININDQDTTSIIILEMTLNSHTAEITCVCVSSEFDRCYFEIYVRTLRSTNASNGETESTLSVVIRLIIEDMFK
ncbi:unnamed protein product [Rotaria sordida]|uniref:Uncharacterized protein n=2 Tax=Rotaria sordida TaxID=392033 RepID=A0A815BPT8_9BILA|nr:unnamed protein product [Rotaria sordida]CAF1555848.1 unnamed protein product [Rotaria sordida]